MDHAPVPPSRLTPKLYDYVKLETQWVPAVDGEMLATDVYLPARDGKPLAGPWPVVLERTPYSRSRKEILDLAFEAVPRGMAYVIQDCRGRGDSGGSFFLMMNEPDEGIDGLYTANWLHEQPWFNGRFATVGGSFSAANQHSLAVNKPKGLVAQIQRDSGTNYYRRMFRNHGLALVGATLPWVVSQALEAPEVRDNPEIYAAISDLNNNPGSWVAELPLRRGSSPLSLAPAYEEIFFTLTESADDTEFWDNPMIRLENYWDDYPTDVAVLLVSGWYGHHLSANMEKLAELGARLGKPVKLLSGPWIHNHYMGQLTTAGDVDYGAVAGQYGPVFELWLSWLEQHLVGHDNGVNDDPALRYFVMGLGDGHKTAEGKIFHGGQWRHSDSWPLPGTRFTKYYLSPGDALGPDAPPADAEPARYDFDPEDPCPGIGSNNLQSTAHNDFILAGPQDQRNRPEFAASRGAAGPLNNRADVLSFATPVLPESTEITGPVSAKVWFETSALDTDLVVKLIDEYPPSEDYPDGYAMLISEGMLRLRYRDDRPIGELLVPGEIYEIDLELAPTSNVFKAGHRIRLDVTSALFPAYDVNPNTGEDLGKHTHTVVAHQVVYRDAAHPSYLLLPVQD